MNSIIKSIASRNLTKKTPLVETMDGPINYNKFNMSP